MGRKYYAYLIIKEFHFRGLCYQDARLDIYRKGYNYEQERKQYDFPKLIKDYKEGEQAECPERLILELFTKEEIDAIKTCFDVSDLLRMEFIYGEEKFPSCFNSLPWSNMPVGGSAERLVFRKNDKVQLNVELGGYVDLAYHGVIGSKLNHKLFELYH